MLCVGGDGLGTEMCVLGIWSCVHDGSVQRFVSISVWPVACVLRGQSGWKVFGGC